MNRARIAVSCQFALLALIFLKVSPAMAQVSAPVSGPVSNNLDQATSQIAPETSTEIEPGASSLVLTDNQTIPFDSIGASLSSTLMSPDQDFATQLRQPLTTVDTSIRDATYIMGVKPRLPYNVVDRIDRRAMQSGSMPAAPSLMSSFTAGNTAVGGMTGSFSLTPGVSAASALSGNIANRIGAVPAILSASTRARGSAQPGNGTIPGPNDAELQSAARKMQQKRQALFPSSGVGSSGSGAGASDNSIMPDDPSRSPLEVSLETLPSDTSQSPLEMGPDESFLHPDIMRPFSPQSIGARGGHRGQNANDRRLNDSFDHSHTFGNSSNSFESAEARLRSRLSSRAQRSLDLDSTRIKPKWHNPLLQNLDTDTMRTQQGIP